jgi:hypothetical protein
MTKQQREYAISRIRTIAGQKKFKCECQKPSLQKHIRRAIAAGCAKVKSAKAITGHFESKIMGDDSYRSDSASITDIFEAPQSYNDAMAELAAEQSKYEAANQDVSRFAQSLIDRVELGEFQDGKDPILLMEAYAPKAPKAKSH